MTTASSPQLDQLEFARRRSRQAADDPTRREDLIRLLATFGESEDPTTMNPNRLRELLGLPAY